MRTLRIVLAQLLAIALLPLAADAWIRLPAFTFATLPAGFAHPEGITADRHGNIYVTTFDVSKAGGPGQLFVFTTIPNVAEAVDPQQGPGPNVLTFDHHGNVYISDSFQGHVWRTGPAGGDPVSWLASPLLRTSGVPPFGANGLAFNKHRTALFVANTGNDTVIKVPVSGTPPVAGTPALFANSINGADGLIIDDDDNVWVAANQADEIVVLNSDGRHIAKLGDFNGIGRDGKPNGLLFPASLVRSGHFIYVTNLALDLKTALGDSFTTGDSEWAAEVTRHTIAVIPAFIPPVPGLKH